MHTGTLFITPTLWVPVQVCSLLYLCRNLHRSPWRWLILLVSLICCVSLGEKCVQVLGYLRYGFLFRRLPTVWKAVQGAS